MTQKVSLRNFDTTSSVTWCFYKSFFIAYRIWISICRHCLWHIKCQDGWFNTVFADYKLCLAIMYSTAIKSHSLFTCQIWGDISFYGIHLGSTSRLGFIRWFSGFPPVCVCELGVVGEQSGLCVCVCNKGRMSCTCRATSVVW